MTAKSRMNTHWQEVQCLAKLFSGLHDKFNRIPTELGFNSAASGGPIPLCPDGIPLGIRRASHDENICSDGNCDQLNCNQIKGSTIKFPHFLLARSTFTTSFNPLLNAQRSASLFHQLSGVNVQNLIANSDSDNNKSD